MSNNLTGPWKGRFDYDTGGKPVAFELELVDVAGQLSGQIVEPNTIKGAKGDTLMASIEGSHDGGTIRFVKYYSGLDQGDDPAYEGQLNATGWRACAARRPTRHPVSAYLCSEKARVGPSVR